MEYDNWRELLTKRFPIRDPDEDHRAWEALKELGPVGQRIQGVVVSKAQFGAWLDIGVGFPALLLIPDIVGMTPDRYQADEWCPIGSTIGAEIVILNDDVRVIRVSQGAPHENRTQKQSPRSDVT